MCEYCSQIELKESFYNPRVYEETIEYIKLLIEEQCFILIDGNCEVGSHKNKNGYWIDDVIFHTIRCPKCSQEFSCIVNTHRGGGSFKKV